ncbi:hypothetical protein EDM22_17700 [Agromyces tardus]|uniref:Uncharacterized protein n=1 Tax=Agromyces tardus TaxID=2583849 RepID=A0A3M7ZYV2_9MICO|nr:hypothetical protein EDM22_17700 [Agromyces tardus]
MPLGRWEPLPYLVLVLLLVATSFIRPNSAPWAYWPLVALIVAALAWLVVLTLGERRQRNPDPLGDLTSLDGLELLDAEPVPGEVRAVVPVADVERHQSSIDLARIHGGPEQHAVLVPRARRWLSRRYRVGVQLLGDPKPRHAGFLKPDADDRWRDRLDAARERGVFVRVPARITGASRPHGVELDLTGLDAALAE